MRYEDKTTTTLDGRKATPEASSSFAAAALFTSVME